MVDTTPWLTVPDSEQPKLENEVEWNASPGVEDTVVPSNKTKTPSKHERLCSLDIQRGRLNNFPRKHTPKKHHRNLTSR